MGSNSVSSGVNTATMNTPTLGGVDAAALDAKLNAMLGMGTFLTAEDMFAFVKQQLLNTDSQVRAQIADVTLRKQMAADLQSISAGLRSVANADKSQQNAKLNELLAKAEQAGLPDAVALLKTMKTDLAAKDGPFTTTRIEGDAQAIDAKMNALTSNVELAMIQIQGTMQQRVQFLQLASHTISILHESAKVAIGNLGKV